MQIYYNDVFLKHDTGSSHPENARRLDAITNRLYKSSLWSGLNLFQLDETTTLNFLKEAAEESDFVSEWVAKTHDAGYYNRINEAAESAPTMIDGDTMMSTGSLEAARLAVAYGLHATKFCHENNSRAMLLVRPPGHHATPERSMGFCLFNNIAVSARYLQSIGYERILIFDFDVHHGNGTQDIFYEDGGVLFMSMHQMPLYPGTGAADETGTGAGAGKTRNFPMQPYAGQSEYTALLDEEIRKEIAEFAPEACLISAGFDAHKDDPLAQIELSSASFGEITGRLLNVLPKPVPVISFLEGGYNLDALAESVESHVEVLAG